MTGYLSFNWSVRLWARILFLFGVPLTVEIKYLEGLGISARIANGGSFTVKMSKQSIDELRQIKSLT